MWRQPEKSTRRKFWIWHVFRKKWPVDVRFIEMMPIGYGKEYHGLDNRRVLEMIKNRYPDLQEAAPAAGAGFGPAVYMQIPGFLGRTGLISPIHGKFCQSCNRLRLYKYRKAEILPLL